MEYKCLQKQTYQLGEFSIVPLRSADRYDIMQWRNDQLYHLRQAEPLTKEIQDNYFDNVVPKLFVADKPNQLLFSYLHNNICIGYGGLVHINWLDKHAEISFVINTIFEKDFFVLHWTNFLALLEQVAFVELKFHKVFTYAFDLRPQLYVALEDASYEREATLKEHCFFEGNFIDVVIHSKYNPNDKL